MAASDVGGTGADPQRVLAVRLDNIGDVVMLTPALRALRARFPRAHLTLLASPAGSTVAPLLPWVDEVRVLRASWQEIDRARQPSAQEELAAIEDLRAGGYDAAYVFTSFSQSPHPPAYFCQLAGIGTRVGQSKEFGGGVLTTWVRAGADAEHQVERSLRLLRESGVPVDDDHLELHLPAEALAGADRLLVQAGVNPEQPFAVLAPGASASSRRWPAERFGEVARQLHDRLGLASVVVGGERDGERAATVAALGGARTAVLAAVTTVPELAAVVARSHVVVTNNSAPMHLADAFGRPVVVPFAGTELESQWHPRHTPYRLLRRPTACSPCFAFTCPYDHECLDLGPDDVVAAVIEVLDEVPAIAGPGARA